MRRKDRIDYKEFAKTGNRKVKPSSGTIHTPVSSESTKKSTSIVTHSFVDVNNTATVGKNISNSIQDYVTSNSNVAFDVLNKTDTQRDSCSSSKVLKSSSEIDNLSNLLNNFSFVDSMAENPDICINENQLFVNESSVSDEITDFIDENPVNEVCISVNECDNILKKVEHFRSCYRKIHKEIQMVHKDYDQVYGKLFAEQMGTIKTYIKNVNFQKRSMQLESKNHDEHHKIEVFKFQIDEVVRRIDDLCQVYITNLQDESNNSIKRRKNELLQLGKESGKIGEKIESLINSAADDDMMRKVNTLKLRYEELLHLKDSYFKNVQNEVEQREIEKNEAFQISSLNIKLGKFKGYDSPVDIYTFQSTFEKIHLKSTPKNLLPDLLKNNFLEGAALTLVKSIEEIDEIWKRLHDAFGNCKIMLTKKLSVFNSMEGLWKHKNPSKVAEELAKLINCMYDVIRLAKRHNIENNLFYGDALERIYKLCGNDRITRWFVVQHDKPWSGEELWQEFIKFLEKDVKIHQQKAILYSSNPEKKSSGNFFASNENRRNDKSSTICFICGEDDHVPTNGPGGSKIIQYFACKKFAEMSPASRYEELCKKGLCIQCLYPGAKYQTSKHKEGKCQRDFICKHPSHDRYATKMHVLVCEDHKDLPDNKNVLHMYKQKCILQQRVELPEYSKKIQLSHHSTFSDNPDDNNEKAIYMLQTIEVDNKAYTIFYDSGCGDFVTTQQAIKKLGKRAIQEYNGPVQLGGVGGIKAETPHGIYSVRLPVIGKHDAIMTGVCLNKITQEFPYYPLNGKVETDIRDAFLKSGGNIKELPKLPEKVGGNVDFMLGIKYLRYFPEVVYQLPSGLTIYKSH